MNANFALAVAVAPSNKSVEFCNGDNAPLLSCQKFVPNPEQVPHAGADPVDVKHVPFPPIPSVVITPRLLKYGRLPCAFNDDRFAPVPPFATGRIPLT